MKSDAILERLLGLHPKSIDLSLGRIEHLLFRLGNPERALPPVVHVAGTNGKGSVVAYLRAILGAAGLRVHVYTSPHLVRFHERIVVAGETISEDALSAFLTECEQANKDAPITFFEITTAAAFLAFSRIPADVVLLETGLGGRLDATNVIERPAVAALTPISLDHQKFLGNDLGDIAAEKAAIMKAGVPCVVSAQERQPMRVIKARAEKVDAPLIVEGEDWFTRKSEGELLYKGPNGERRLPLPALAGAHQMRNAGQAVACAEALARRCDLSIPDAALALGLQGVRWPGRLQDLSATELGRALGDGWELWLDGGHNPAAAKMLASQARAWRDKPLYGIVGMLDSRDPAAFLKPLAPRLRRLACIAIPGEANAIAAKDLAAAAAGLGIDAEPVDCLEAALGAVTRDEGPGRVLICGSLYLAGHVLERAGTLPQ